MRQDSRAHLGTVQGRSGNLNTVTTLQEYIENENQRLEREQQFWSKEIVVKIEYKYCPNLTIIDTPGGSVSGRRFKCKLPSCLRSCPLYIIPSAFKRAPLCALDMPVIVALPCC